MTTVAAMTELVAARPRRWGIRQRVVASYVGLLAAAIVVTLFASWLALVDRMEDDIESALAQEIEEVRRLSGGTDPATGQPFGDDVAAIFRKFLSRNVPSDAEAFFTYIDGQLFLASFDAPRALLDDPALPAAWGAATEPTWDRADTAAGEAWSLAVPIVGSDGRVLGVFVVVQFPAGARAELLDVMRTAAIAGALVLAAAAVAAWTLGGRVLHPIRRLTDTAHAITDTDLSRRIPVTGNDELADLGTTFNAMLDRLERGFTGQRQFLDDVAHELRTPITIVQGHLELMGDDPAERAETLMIVHDELDRMNRYVNDLLLLAKSETTEFLRPEPIDLGELAASVGSKLPGLGDRAWIVTGPNPGSVAIVGDPGRLTQALLNLASNAVQHTSPGDAIEVGAQGLGHDGARLWVRDSGHGLEPGLAERIFDRSARGAASRSARADGMGLGLAIVAAIARAHGGDVSANDAPGGGAVFTITLPVEPPATPPEERIA